MRTPKDLIAEALNLSPAERLIIAEALIQSFDKPDLEIQQTWGEEVEKRLAAYKEGKLETIDFEDLFNN